ncbi:PAQR family membrane homeostasis protein TrhA [Treponema sp.]|uniref:PAQR family membrane homeostasis protein TrhA n=1 Tax=Treponema sp. TaxID=166 RepID=UPI003F0F909C
MGDITRRITRKSLKAKRKSAIKTIKAQAREKIHQIKVDYSMDAEKKKQKAAEREHKRELRAQKANARLSYSARQPRPFTLGEDLLSSIANGIAAGLSVSAIVLLVVRAYFYAPAAQRGLFISTFAVFGASLFILHLTATLYHAISPSAVKKLFSVFNHCAIYFYIGGIFTPLLLARGTGGTASCVVMWGILAVLLALYAVFGARLHSFSVFTYIVLAAVLVGMIGAGVVSVGFSGKVFFFSAAILYAMSLGFFVMRNFKWTHSIFHLFAIGAAVLVFFGIYSLV